MLEGGPLAFRGSGGGLTGLRCSTWNSSAAQHSSCSRCGLWNAAVLRNLFRDLKECAWSLRKAEAVGRREAAREGSSAKERKETCSA